MIGEGREFLDAIVTREQETFDDRRERRLLTVHVRYPEKHVCLSPPVAAQPEESLSAHARLTSSFFGGCQDSMPRQCEIHELPRAVLADPFRREFSRTVSNGAVRDARRRLGSRPEQ